jgi:mannose-1-phosphate guanylyltransferase
MSSPSLYVLILAGGSGERFWPLSRKSRPKQLLSLFGGETLLESTLRRLEGLVPAQNILILTNAEQEAAVRTLAPGLPAENIVAEPAKRDTGAAIALGVGWVASRETEATMIVLPADHLIKDTAGFQATLTTAVTAARQTGVLVTIGIQPTWGCPGFGYIECNGAVEIRDAADGPKVYDVQSFREKPNTELAEQFVRQGNFRWNAGMFIWTIPAILSALRTHAPELGGFVTRMRAGEDFTALLRDAFPKLPKISIDYAVMEKAGRVLMVESAFDWDDVGSWTAIAKYLADQGDGNVGNTGVSAADASGNIVFSSQKRRVALLGVNDFIVVDTPDALLVCSRHEAERIKHLVAKIPAELQ